METEWTGPTIPVRYSKLGAEHPRRRHWSYIKQRKNPTGIMGRPKSPIPVAERRRQARQQYQSNLTQRGQRLIRLLLSAEAAARLENLAKDRGVSLGQIVEDLLLPAATNPEQSLPVTAKPVQEEKPVQNPPVTEPAPNPLVSKPAPAPPVAEPAPNPPVTEPATTPPVAEPAKTPPVAQTTQAEQAPGFWNSWYRPD